MRSSVNLMPYVITKSNQACYDGIKHLRPLPGSVARHAVATLAECLEYEQSIALAAGVDLLNVFATDRTLTDQYAAMTEYGGTVGPLPDGTVITVEQAGLASMAGSPVKHYNPAHTSEIIAAFNAAQN
jgi:hypothetical protein